MRAFRAFVTSWGREGRDRSYVGEDVRRNGAIANGTEQCVDENREWMCDETRLQDYSVLR